jgi:hypothetical protein
MSQPTKRANNHMTKHHTATPWHVGAGNGADAIFADSGRMRLEPGGTTLYPVCTVVRGWNEAEDQANARLIAAAPELLAALRGLLVQLEGPQCLASDHPGSFYMAELIRAQDAIAKATGGRDQ